MKAISKIFKASRPQMTNREIEYIRSKSRDYTHLIEFGSGVSTLLWEKSFSKVTSVETRILWYEKIKPQLQNPATEYLFCPPESRAFGTNGQELWNHRVPSDYGTTEEFSGYIKLAKQIIETIDEKGIFFVDGNTRKEICELILGNDKNFLVMLHDVIPERDYLNNWTKNDDGIEIVIQIDSLLVLTKR